MKVFVTGATGFVGQEILFRLHQAGHSIRFLAPHPASPVVRELHSNYGAEPAPGNVLDPAPLEDAVAGTEAVIHLVGIISEIGANTFENIHTCGTLNMLAAARRGGVRRFIHMSALGTRVNAVSLFCEPLCEDHSPFAPRSRAR